MNSMKWTARVAMGCPRLAPVLTAVLLVAWGDRGALAAPPGSSGTRPRSDVGSSAKVEPTPETPAVGGDTFVSAVVIPGLPYSDAGYTCGFRDDYIPPCLGPCAPFTPCGPDVVYRFTPQTDMCVDISLCNSSYDTSLYVFENLVSNPLACNDDLCGPTGQQSRLHDLTLRAGNSYFIVVDGFQDGCGSYNITVTSCVPCPGVSCPAGAIQEGEPVCYDGYIDSYNGGCNSSPAVYQSIPCAPGVTTSVCGTYGTYFTSGLQNRDTDWYAITLADFATVHICLEGDAPSQFSIVDAPRGGCSASSLCFTRTQECERLCCDATLAPGTYWIVVATSEFDRIPCGSRYVLEVTCSSTVTPVCDVRHDGDGNCIADALNAPVTIEGVVLSWKEFGGSGPGAIYDPVSRCCVSVFDLFNAPIVPIGSQVRISGWMGEFMGLDELVDNPATGTPDPSVTVLGVGVPPAPRPIDAADIAANNPTAEILESCLIQLCGRFTTSGNFAGNVNYPFTDRFGSTCDVRIDVDTNIDGTPIPTGEVTVVAVLSQFDRTGSGGTVRVPCTGYQALPRSLADIRPADCATVVVRDQTWSGMKELYR